MSSGMHPVRHFLAARDKGWTCWYCDALVVCPTCAPGTNAPGTIDHVQPRAKGGTSAIANLRLACYTCNHDKADAESPEAGRRNRREEWRP